MTNEEIVNIANDVYEYLHPFCIAIYLGGSYCQDYIKNKGDVDFICFANKPVDMCHIRRLLYFYQKKHQLPKNCDFIQVRNKCNEEHAYGSYINKEMIKLVGEDIEFKFDVINKDRQEYANILIDTIKKLESGKIINQKRWYQVLRGYYILKKRTYALDNQEIATLNMVHDQKEGWEKYKITVDDIKKEIEQYVKFTENCKSYTDTI